tara:strand:+ start:482 stop:2734 length:2253 start_codon:yes stop_codon:yes gene_type:complete
MKNKLFFKKKILILILIFLFIPLNVNSKIIKKFEIKGNERVSNQTIIIFSNLKIGDDVNQNDLNNALKEIFSTNYFKDVNLSLKDGIVKINVLENPIIQSVLISGIKKKNILEKLEEITAKIEKYPFVENQINEQVILLKNILKSYGYYFVKLDTSINLNNNNTIDLIYNFNLGDIAKINKIYFIGNKVFRDNTLRNVIISEESKFWKFITRNKFVDSQRIKADVARLNKFYKNRGYYNVKVKSTSTIINENNQFELIFNIDSGNKFYFNNFIFSPNKNIPQQSIEKFENKTKELKGKKYSKKIVDDLVDDLNQFALRNEFIFINAKFNEKIVQNNLIDIKINFDQLDKNFVERINILGNFITDEKVIRNTLIIDEGDPYNEILFDKSIKNLKAKNIFKSVNYKTENINSSYKKIINIKVEEKPTGEIFAGAGTGTTGTSLTAGVKENNYLGLGITLDTNLTITDDTLKGKFSVLNPNYKNSDKSVKTSIENTTNDFMSSSGYKTNRIGFTLGTGFEQMTDFYVNLETLSFYEDLETSSKANNIIKKQEGNYFENLISYSISYNKLDQNYQPTDGFINKFSQTLPIISDDASLENSFTSSIFHSVNENLILSANLYLKAINSLDDNVRISKRVYVPTRLLKGFESGKIGPKDGTQYIGGNYATALNLNSTLPNLLFENDNVDFNFFIDMANVWKVDYDSSLDSNKIRSSTGISINWFSAIGPLTFSYAIPLSEAKTDITEKFRFQIGTSF